MTEDEKWRKVQDLFSSLCTEILYGFNMKTQMVNLQEEELIWVEQFVKRCKEARK